MKLAELQDLSKEPHHVKAFVRANPDGEFEVDPGQDVHVWVDWSNSGRDLLEIDIAAASKEKAVEAMKHALADLKKKGIIKTTPASGLYQLARRRVSKLHSTPVDLAHEGWADIKL